MSSQASDSGESSPSTTASPASSPCSRPASVADDSDVSSLDNDDYDWIDNQPGSQSILGTSPPATEGMGESWVDEYGASLSSASLQDFSQLHPRHVSSHSTIDASTDPLASAAIFGHASTPRESTHSLNQSTPTASSLATSARMQSSAELGQSELILPDPNCAVSYNQTSLPHPLAEPLFDTQSLVRGPFRDGASEDGSEDGSWPSSPALAPREVDVG